MEWVISVPTKVRQTKKKFFHLNLNVYRNAHHRVLSKAKVDWDELVAPTLAHLPVFDRIRISYILFTGSAQECDIMNVVSIVDKFFCDSLVKAGKLPDDNYNHVINTISGFGGIDRLNPRVDVVIESLAPTT